MCIVIAGIGTGLPTRNELKVSCVNNPDGFGWAIVSSQKDVKVLDVRRSMVAAVAIDTFFEKMSQLGQSVVAWTFHARIYTHGKISLANTHPFFVGDDELTVLAHNGILPVTIAEDDDRSDSKVFAEEYLPALGGILGLAKQVQYDLVEGFVYGANSKVVILTAHPEAKYALLIFGETTGHWRKGKNGNDVWFSNHSYEPYSWLGTGTNYRSRSITSTGRYDQFTAGGFEADMANLKTTLLTKREADDATMYTRCITKGCQGLVEEWDDICEKCDTCQSCELDRLACLCWQPSLSARERASVSELLALSERTS